MALPRTERLTPERWAVAALILGAREGLAAINMERVAAELGVTKGSAYHHFSSRAALLDSALELWKKRATQDLIDQLNDLASPHERLAAILGASIGRDPRDGLEYYILTSQDPIATPVIDAVTTARLRFLEEIYRDFGLDEHRSRLWARSCYSTYLGLQVLRHTLPTDAQVGTGTSADITEMVQQLTPPATDSAS
ncbi:TetR/AcrR family transcriptional regulator [Salinibacterium sp. UTAS2018]|uniref:TetR/AcrR family transcriptional regulator n=1 Tax=Salinibacterium sp. UTAS2018 TaxID=2508880 RepID=UPI00143CFFDB|nr:TetR family transcriptional regulator [Salinibacterium sp. UTAS2018]